MARKRLSELKSDVEALAKRISAIENPEDQVEEKMEKIENQPADKGVTDKAKEIVKDEAQAVNKSLENLSGVKVDETMNYDGNNNTKMSSTKVASKLIELAKLLLKD